MLTKHEQEILDNAPNWAECFIRSSGGNYSYAKYVGASMKVFCNSGGNMQYSSIWCLIHDLTDLRKKQGKTVVDAVNYFKGVWPHSGHKCASFSHDEWTFFFKDVDEYHACTIEEFNQCVKEMSEARWMNKSGDFFCYESYKEDYTEPVKPRTKVEYVKVNDSEYWECAKEYTELGEFYSFIGDGYLLVDSHNELLGKYEQNNLYHKVETEVKTEKRYVCYDESGKFVCEMGNGPANSAWQIIEITVEV